MVVTMVVLVARVLRLQVVLNVVAADALGSGDDATDVNGSSLALLVVIATRHSMGVNY